MSKITFSRVAADVIKNKMRHNNNCKVFYPITRNWIDEETAKRNFYRHFEDLSDFLDNGNILKLSQKGRIIGLSESESIFVLIILQQFAKGKGPAYDIVKAKKNLSLPEAEDFIRSIVQEMIRLNALPKDKDGYFFNNNFDEIVNGSKLFWINRCREMFKEIFDNLDSLTYSSQLYLLSELSDFLERKKNIFDPNYSKLSEF